jgi:hypothetical protein
LTRFTSQNAIQALPASATVMLVLRGTWVPSFMPDADLVLAGAGILLLLERLDVAFAGLVVVVDDVGRFLDALPVVHSRFRTAIAALPSVLSRAGL